MSSEIALGGQAVMEGVLMRTKTHYAVAVRAPNNKIIVKREFIKTAGNKYKIFRLPLMRGILALYETIGIGFKALLYSANVSSDDKEQFSKKELTIAVVVSLALAIGIFIAAPFFFASLITKNSILFNIIDGILRLVALIGYLIVISFFRDVQRLFQYHGAEHMTIHAYENKEKLTPKNIKKYKTMHPRCGTSFLLIVVILSIFVFSIVTAENHFIKFFLRLLLVPLIAAISYELLKLSAKYKNNFLVKPFMMPGIWLQYITTKRPDNKQIEVAKAALKELVR